MGSSTISGTVEAPEFVADYTRTEPQEVVVGGNYPGAGNHLFVFTFQNGGNVEQTLNYADVSALVSCSKDATYADGIYDGGTSMGNEMVLPVGKAVDVRVKMVFPELAEGASDQDYSFELNWSWPSDPA